MKPPTTPLPLFDKALAAVKSPKPPSRKRRTRDMFAPYPAESERMPQTEPRQSFREILQDFAAQEKLFADDREHGKKMLRRLRRQFEGPKPVSDAMLTTVRDYIHKGLISGQFSINTVKLDQILRGRSFTLGTSRPTLLDKLWRAQAIITRGTVMGSRLAAAGRHFDIEKSRGGVGDNGGFMGSGRIENSFSDMSISSNNSGGFALVNDIDTFSNKSNGRQPSSVAPPPPPSIGLAMLLGIAEMTNKSRIILRDEFVEDLQPKVGQSRSAAPPLTDPVTLTVEEKLNVTLTRDGGFSRFYVQGQLSLHILNQEDANIQVQIETGGNPSVIFKTPPNMNKELFTNESILGLKDPNRPFPTGQTGDAAGVDLLKWRMQSSDKSMVPLSINCWPSVSNHKTYISIEYEASSLFDLRNVVISVPIPIRDEPYLRKVGGKWRWWVRPIREAPLVEHVDGEWRYDKRNSILEWSIFLIDNDNRSGSLEFVHFSPDNPADSSPFFPISVQFSAISTYSDLKVVNILPMKGGPSPKFSQRTQLITDNYQVV